MNTKVKPGNLIKWIFSLIDLIILNFSFLFSGLLADHEMIQSRILWFCLNISYCIVIFFRKDIHDQRILYADRLALHAIKSILLHSAIFLSVLVFLEEFVHTKLLVLFYINFSFSIITWWQLSRIILKKYRHKGFNFRNIIIIGNSTVAQRFIDEIKSNSGYGYRLLKVYEDTQSSCATIKEIEKFIKDKQIDELYCAVPDNNENRISQLIKIADNNAVDFYYLPQLGPTVTGQFSLLSYGNIPVMSLRQNPLHNVINSAIKRIFDIFVSTIFLIISPLVIIPVTIAIKLSSPGPVFFKQKRTGFRGKEFICYKFRTLKVEKLDKSIQVTLDDNRLTSVGKFLRHYSIDELPQFYNVWKGDMSIVGPRPHMIAHTQQYSKLIDKYMLRHTIKPGITGWAQVNGYRGLTDELWMMEKRVEYDVWYAANWNFMLDVKIILLTIYKVFRGDENAF